VRRSAAVVAGAVAGGVLSGSLRAGDAAAVTSLRRCVALGPAGCIEPGGSQDLRAYGNRRLLGHSATRWVRLWADWPSLMPTAGAYDAARVAALDAQIAQARRDGLRVVLTLYRFPAWANGTGVLTSEQLAATMPDRRRPGAPAASAKSVLLRYPDDVSAASAWGGFVAWLVARYARTSVTRPDPAAWIDVLELCNEPNLMWWPQRGAVEVVARMFATAQAITARYGGEPVLAGPATADVTGSGRLRTGYDVFADRLLTALAASGFTPGARFAWTHHNYADVGYDLGAGCTAPASASIAERTANRAADARRRLVGRWAGWPAADPLRPQLMITEGGVTLPTVARIWGIGGAAAQQAKQAELLERSFARMSSAGEGAGIAMLTQYLFYTDPNYDSGLCETVQAGGAARSAYAVWGSLRSYA
jgi:hypothetical protein